jgi:hypothetical protein
MQRNLNYGIKSLNVHAIGQSNIKKVRNVVNTISDKYGMDAKSEQLGGRISVKLEIRVVDIGSNAP